MELKIMYTCALYLNTQTLNTGSSVAVRPSGTKMANAHPLPLYDLRAEALVKPEVLYMHIACIHIQNKLRMYIHY